MTKDASVYVSMDDVLQHLPDQAIKTSRRRGWSGVTVDLHAGVRDYYARAMIRDHHLICFAPQGRGRLIQRRAGKIHDTIISAGMSILSPAGYESQSEGEPPMSARIRLPADLTALAAEEIGARPSPGFEIVNVFQTQDPVLEGISRLLLAEIDLAPHPTQQLVIESLSCALASHLLRRYNAFDPPAATRQQGLDPQIVALVAQYIEDNLEAVISLTELAGIAQISRFNFSRQFRRSTGFSPIAYVERARLRRAESLLREGRLPLAEIALEVGFCDQSEFTRRFRRQYGTTPGVFAREAGAGLPRRRGR